MPNSSFRWRPQQALGYSVGFHSERTFRRVFHDHVGCSPSEYRKRWLEKRVPVEPA